jgi:hypothetical protein
VHVSLQIVEPMIGAAPEAQANELVTHRWSLQHQPHGTPVPLLNEDMHWSGSTIQAHGSCTQRGTSSVPFVAHLEPKLQHWTPASAAQQS